MESLQLNGEGLGQAVCQADDMVFLLDIGETGWPKGFSEVSQAATRILWRASTTSAKSGCLTAFS